MIILIYKQYFHHFFDTLSTNFPTVKPIYCIYLMHRLLKSKNYFKVSLKSEDMSALIMLDKIVIYISLKSSTILSE